MKKFLKIALLAMTAVMLLCVSVGAADVTTLYSDGTNGHDANLTVVVGEGETVTWMSNDTTVAKVDTNGHVTAVSDGNATVMAMVDGTVKESFEIKVVKRSLSSIEATSNKTSYTSGQLFDASSLSVMATYNNGDSEPVSYTKYEPTDALRVDDKVVTVYYGEKSDTIDITVAEVYPTDFDFAVGNKVSYKVGEKASAIAIVVKFSNGDKATLSGGFTQVPSATTALKVTDTAIEVTYQGITHSLPITVADVAVTHTAELKGTLSKTTYKVGESIKFDGITVDLKDGETVAKTLTPSDLASVCKYTFVTADIGNKTLTFTITYSGNSYRLTLPSVKVESAATELDFYAITDVELAEEKYPIGYKFSTSDITRIYYREKRTSTKTSYIKGSELSNYSNDFDLQVLDEDGDEKSSKYAHELEEDDVTTSSSGKQTATLALFIDEDNECEITVDVGDSGFAFYYDGDLIKTYDDLEDALDATLEQDKDVDTDDFDLDDVSDKKYILIKLGEDYEISSRYDDFDPEHNIVIDLNGHKLTFYTDTIEISRNNDDYTVIIKNSSKTAAKFIYDDKDNGEITLAEDEELVFEYDEDLPGFYTLTIKAGTNGSILVKGNTKAVTSLEAAHGSEITLTVTPDKGYQIDTVKYDGKTLSTTSQTVPYVVDKNGVATVTLKGIAKSAALEATFKKVTEEKTEEKKEETTKKWNNPFSDITDRSQYYSAVEFVCTNELFNGVSATKFAPENTMTRAMFVTVLGRLAAKTQNIDFTQYNTSSFTDVSASNPQNGYAAPYIEWASRVGIVEGYGDGTFGPNNNITHQQMYLMMQRYASFIEHKYTDASQTSLTAGDKASVADWALNGVKYAQSANIMVSTSRIDPAGNALRWELATVLMLFCQNVLNGSIK